MKSKLWMGLALTLLLTGCAAQAPSQSGLSTEPEQAALPAIAPTPIPEPEPEPESPTLEEQAQAIVSELSDEELVGQLFFVRWPETGAAELAATYHLGGYILFGREFKNNTPDGVRQMITACQEVSSIPMLMAVDEEGGTVVRASCYPAFRSERFQSPQKVYASGGLEAVRADALEKSDFLLDLGLNVNLAPVCDVSTDPKDFIYARSFGQGAQETAEYVAAVVEAMNEAGIGSVLKHFPGYGDNADTHTGIALDNRPLEHFLSSDLLPFQSGAQAGAGGVLVSHNIVSCLDPDLPASLSPAVYALLRDEVGFTGAAMTDDLDMAAVKEYVDNGNAAAAAFRAGADMVLTSAPQSQIPQVLAALTDGSLSHARLEEAAVRVLVWKMELGLIPAQA